MYSIAWECKDSRIIDVGMPNTNYEDTVILVNHLIDFDEMCGIEAQYFICEV